MATFGDTTAGADTFPTTPDRACLSKFTLTETATVTAINVRFSGSGALNFKGLVYDNDGTAGAAGTMLIASSSTAAAVGDITATASGSLSAGDYWLGAVCDNSGFTFVCDVSGDLTRMEGCTYASPPSWTESGTSVARMNVYVTYTPSAGGPTGTLVRNFYVMP